MPRIAGERLPATYINHYTANGVPPQPLPCCVDLAARWGASVCWSHVPPRRVSRCSWFNGGNNVQRIRLWGISVSFSA